MSSPAVILTKVRIQDYSARRSWLRVLTFVRMTVVVKPGTQTPLAR